MKTSDILTISIRRFESFRCKAYQDAKGVWTIGYGHTTDVKKGDCITRKVAEQLLLEDLNTFETFVDSLNICNSQFQFDALVDFAYNCGIENLRTSTLLRYIREGKPKEEIRKEFLRWTYSGGHRLRGLAIRRKWEADRFFGRTTPFSFWDKIKFRLY